MMLQPGPQSQLFSLAAVTIAVTIVAVVASDVSVLASQVYKIGLISGSMFALLFNVFIANLPFVNEFTYTCHPIVLGISALGVLADNSRLYSLLGNFSTCGFVYSVGVLTGSAAVFFCFYCIRCIKFHLANH